MYWQSLSSFLGGFPDAVRVTNLELLKRLKVKYFDKKDHSDKKKAIEDEFSIVNDIIYYARDIHEHVFAYDFVDLDEKRPYCILQLINLAYGYT